MRILAIERDLSACNYYRIALPLGKLEEHGFAETEFIAQGPELNSDEAFAKLLWSDIVVFHRPSTYEWFDFIKKCQRNGKLIICDYDDDPFNTSPWNPYYRVIGIQEFEYQWPDGTKEWLWKDGHNGFDIENNIMRRDLFRACYKSADMITTTTDILAESLKKINVNTKVLPNLIDIGFYPNCEIKRKGVRIGWQGGYSHYEDLWLVKDDIRKILQDYPETTFVYLGDPKFKGLFKDFPQNQFEMHTWTSQETYPYKLKTMNIDIGLCPLYDNEFARKKSAIKHFEYAMVGACTLASDIPPYSSVIKNGETGRLVQDKSWYYAMREMVTDKAKRDRFARSAYDDIVKNYNIDKRVGEWAEAYKTLLKQEVTV